MPFSRTFRRYLASVVLVFVFAAHVQGQLMPAGPAGGDLKIKTLDGDEVASRAIVSADDTVKRGFFDDVGNTLGDLASSVFGGGSNSSNSSSPSFFDEIGDLFKNGTSFISTIGNLLSGNTSIIDVIGSLVGDVTNLTELATPALFLGIGVGDGLATGLNLTTASQAAIFADNAVNASGANNTGLNAVALNLAKGLTSVIIPAVTSGGGNLNITDLLSSLDLPALAEGAGTGAADGVSTSLQPVLGTSVFQVSESQAVLNDTLSTVAYSFLRGLSSEATQWGIGFFGVGNTSVAAKLAVRDLPGKRAAKRRHVTQMFGSRHARRATPNVLLSNSSKTDIMVTDLAQTAVSTLTCKGVGGMLSVIEGASSNLGSSGLDLNTSNMTMPDINIAVTNGGNYFHVQLSPMAITVNGVEVENLVKFLAVHSKSPAYLPTYLPRSLGSI